MLSVLQLMWMHPLVYEAEEERKALKAKEEAEWAAAEEEESECEESSEAIAILDSSDNVRAVG